MAISHLHQLLSSFASYYTVPVAILLALFVSAFLHLILKTLASPQGHKFPPGPRPLPLIGSLHLLGDKPHQSLAKLALTHGPLMSIRLGSIRYVVASTPEMAKYFLQTYDHSYASRPRSAATSLILFDSSDLAFAPYGPYWKLIRRICMTDLFHPKRLDSYLPIRLEEARDLIRGFFERSRAGHSIVVRPKVQEAANNIISRMTLSKTYKELSSSSKAGDIVALIDEIMLLLGVPNVGDFIPSLAWMDLQGWEKRMKEVRKKVQIALGEVIEERRAEMRARASEQKSSKADRREDFLDLLLNMNATEQISDDSITAVVLDMYLGGTDTTSITTEWALAELLSSPACLREAQEELDRVVGRSRLVEDSDMEDLPYLQAVVRETFRLHPAAPLLLPRQGMQECTIAGYNLPKGTCAYVNVWAIGRDQETWGDPMIFRPERFIGSEVDEKGQHFELIPFGAGRRRCVGWELGLLNVRLFLGRLLQCFNWKLPPGGTVDMAEQFGLTVMMQNSLTVQVSPRLPANLY